MKISFSRILSNLVFLFIVWTLKSCTSPETQSGPTFLYSKDDNIRAEKSIPDSIAKWYELINTDIDAVNHNYFLYMHDTSMIDLVNNYLMIYLNANGDEYVDIYYFDNKKTGDGCLKKELDDQISEKKKNALFKHFIAHFFYNPSNHESNLFYIQS